MEPILWRGGGRSEDEALVHGRPSLREPSEVRERARLGEHGPALAIVITDGGQDRDRVGRQAKGSSQIAHLADELGQVHHVVAPARCVPGLAGHHDPLLVAGAGPFVVGALVGDVAAQQQGVGHQGSVRHAVPDLEEALEDRLRLVQSAALDVFDGDAQERPTGGPLVP
jgi:hypothetical protein